MLRLRHPSMVLCTVLPLLGACQDRPLPTDPNVAPSFAQSSAAPVVNSLADPGDGICDDTECTLREAVAFAATGAIITFSVNGTLTLSDSIVLDRDVSIRGPGSDALTVQRDPATGTPEYCFLVIRSGATVAVSHLTATNFFSGLQGGQPSTIGSTIRNAGALTIDNVVLTGNHAVAGGTVINYGTVVVGHSRIANNFGHGLFNSSHAHMTVRHTTISDNHQSFRGIGGGGVINGNGGNLVIENSRILDNVTADVGGGLLNSGVATITNSTIAGNTARIGGGIGVDVRFARDAILTLTNSTVSSNTAHEEGGGIAADQITTITQSNVSGNRAARGGGIFWFAHGINTLTGTRVSGNNAAEGGGIYCDCDFGEAHLTNNTISGNSATTSGGGFLATSPGFVEARISHTTFHGNTAPIGAAIHLKNLDGTTLSGFTSLRNTIVAGAAGADHCRADHVGGAGSLVIVDQGHNIDSGSSCNFTHAASKSATNPMLGPLADNGGPTWTHALLSGSPAIDAGTCLDNAGTTVTVDQRGVARPRGAACDIGAYEASIYSFSGFFVPVDNPPLFNVVKAGSAIAVKFSLGGNFGLDIMAAGSPASQDVPCNAAAGSAAIEATVNAGHSSLSYDAASGRYTYVWKTDKTWAGTCREFRLVLEDGTTQTALFSFTK